MEANELMIGDWVKFTSKYGYGTGQVVGIEPREGSAEPTTFTILEKGKEGNTNLFVSVSKNCVNPIPLTPETLEKNGFTDCETTPSDLEGGNQFWYLGEEGFISNSELMVNLLPNHKGFLVRNGNNTMYYREKAVHLLQRFLLDNEIDKEIVL